MTPDQLKQLDADIAEWLKLQEWMAVGKEREMNLRKSIAERAMGSTKLANGAFPEGTQKGSVEGADGQRYAVKLTTKWSRDVLPEMISSVWAQAQLTADEAKDLLKYKPEISVRAYKALPEAKKVIIDQMITCKQGSIALEVIPLPK